MTCGACGTSNEVDSIFCIECGTKIPEIEMENQDRAEIILKHVRKEFDKWRQDPYYTPIFRVPPLETDMTIPNEPFESFTIRKGLDGRKPKAKRRKTKAWY